MKGRVLPEKLPSERSHHLVEVRRHAAERERDRCKSAPDIRYSVKPLYSDQEICSLYKG